MQENSDTWTQNSDLVQTKVERLRSLSPEELGELSAQWRTLVGEIRSVLDADPASPVAQALGARWTTLLAKLMGRAVDAGELGRHQRSEEWNPRMATFVDKAVWDFITRVLAIGHD